MSFGLGHGRELDPAPGIVGVSPEELPPLPDAALLDPALGRIDPRLWFPDPGSRFEIEIGCGKGAFLLQQGSADSAVNLLGIEHAREFYAYAADRIRRAGLRNVRVLNTDALEFVRRRVPDAIVAAIHLYFPDPWPKARHRKRRMVQDVFLAHARRVLLPGGALHVVTDHDAYWAWMETHFARWCAPATGDGPGGFAREPFVSVTSVAEGELVGTNFERKYRREGRPFHAATLRRTATD